MKIDNYHVAKSSFLSVEKDLSIFTDLILSNHNLQKLLYYTTRDALSQPVLSKDKQVELLGKNIKIVPKLYVDGSVLNYIIISFDDFTVNSNNPEFRDSVISFDIICHFDQWELSDFKLRPYRIAAEIDTMINGKRLSGIGTLQFLSCNQVILDDEFAGLSLMYSAIHGEEDKKKMINPTDEEQMLANFKNMIKLQ